MKSASSLLHLLLASAIAAQTPLAAVNVEAAKPTAKMAGFEERRLQGHGRFITLDQIQKQEHKRFSDIIGQLPGAMVSPNGSASGMLVASSRGVHSHAVQSDQFRHVRSIARMDTVSARE